jgi:hypothetical protein
MELFYKDQNNQYKELADIDGQIKFKAFGQIPVQFQETLRTQNTDQTHTGASILANAWNQGSWIDVTGYDNLIATVLNDATTSCSVEVAFSHDKTNVISIGSATSAASGYCEYAIPVKARYARVAIKNGDAAAPHTMSSWLFKKS